MENIKVEWVSANNESRPLEKHLHILDNVGIKRTGNFYKDDDLGIILLINKTELYNQFLVYEKDFNHYWYLSEINETRLSLPAEPLEACSGDEDNRYCWLNINDGKFSDSWGEDSMKYLDDELLAIAKNDGFKLIKYQCINDNKFEFYKRMQLASYQSKSLNESVELSEAVKELLQVKEWKDKYGKDEQYLKAQPIAWANLKTAYDAFLSQLKQ